MKIDLRVKGLYMLGAIAMLSIGGFLVKPNYGLTITAGQNTLTSVENLSLLVFLTSIFGMFVLPVISARSQNRNVNKS